MATFYRCDRCRQEVADIAVVSVPDHKELCMRCLDGLRDWLKPITADAAVRRLAGKKR